MADQFNSTEENEEVGVPGGEDPESPPPVEGEVPPPPPENPPPDPDPEPEPEPELPGTNPPGEAP